MPTYEYECPKCPRVFEVRQRITEPALVTCDRCGGPIHRLLSPAPFILKGGGWYVTDYPVRGAEEGHVVRIGLEGVDGEGVDVEGVVERWRKRRVQAGGVIGEQV